MTYAERALLLHISQWLIDNITKHNLFTGPLANDPSAVRMKTFIETGEQLIAAVKEETPPNPFISM